MESNKFPRIKKTVSRFLLNESGSITKKNILKIGAILAIGAVATSLSSDPATSHCDSADAHTNTPDIHINGNLYQEVIDMSDHSNCDCHCSAHGSCDDKAVADNPRDVIFDHINNLQTSELGTDITATHDHNLGHANGHANAAEHGSDHDNSHCSDSSAHTNTQHNNIDESYQY